MDYFDLMYYLISKEAREACEANSNLEIEALKLKKELYELNVLEAVTKAKMARGEISIYPMLEIASAGKKIEIIACLVNTRLYGKTIKNIKKGLINSSYDEEGPNDVHFKNMNFLRKQIKSFTAAMRKPYGIDDAKGNWLTIMSKSKRSRKKGYIGKIDFRKIKSINVIDSSLIDKYNYILGKIYSNEKILALVESRKAERIKILNDKHSKSQVLGTCSICLEDDELVRLRCGHGYHVQCITDLFYTMLDNWEMCPAVKCPLCRVILN